MQAKTPTKEQGNGYYLQVFKDGEAGDFAFAIYRRPLRGKAAVRLKQSRASDK